MDFTCKDCENREPSCHGRCEKYKAEKAKYDERKERKRKQADIASGLKDQKMQGVNKALKRYGHSKRK